MAKLRTFTICMTMILSMVTLIDGRSKMQQDSPAKKLSMPETLPGNQGNGAALLKSTGTHSLDLSSEAVSKGKVGRTSHRRERTRNRKSKKRPRKNRQRASSGHQNIESNDIIRETMIQMFGFDHMPPRSSCHGFDCSRQAIRSASTIPSDTSFENSLNAAQFKPSPPSFMLELYRSYSEDKDLMILHSKSQGNTVRSFFPSPANPQHRERNFGQAVVISPVPESGPQFASTSVFLYNITLIPEVEDLVAAEIRLDGPLAESQTDVMVGVYREQRQCEDGLDCNDSPNKIFTKIGRTVFLKSVSGTRWSDPKLARLAKRARQNGNVVVFRFLNDREDTSPLRMRRHFERKRDLPPSFICNDAPASRNRRSPNDMQDDRVLSSESSVPIFIAYCNDPRTSSEAENVPAAPLIWKALENVTSSRRVKRSVDPTSGRPATRDPHGDGPESPTVPSEKRSQHTRDAPSRNSVYVVEKRKNGSKRRRKNSKNNLQVPRNSTSNAIDTPNRRQSKKNRNRGKNNRRSGRRNRPHKNERVDIKLHSSLLAEERKQSCRRRSLTVSFADIGWSPWIISPEHFEAYYCSGNCDLKQAEETSATNHAIIQSVVKNIAGHSDLPSPCCVPDKLMSLSVLFFDQDRNVVLKNFPNMSVETCGCR